MKALSIHIPTPCHEDWQQMTPVDKGRFCQSCAKQVVDFSVMSDQQILNYISKASGGMCGRFAGDQLQRPLQPVQQGNKRSWWIAAMMPLLLLFEKASAQRKDNTENIIKLKEGDSDIVVVVGYISRRGGASDYAHIPDEYSPPIKANMYDARIIAKRQKGNSHFIVEGNIVSASTGAPVPLASIAIKGDRFSAVTDSSGYFKLQGNTTDPHCVLTIYKFGFIEAEAFVRIKNIASTDNITSYTIKGNIIDADNGNAVASASITVAKSQIATVSDADGNFSLNTGSKNPNHLITVSSVGFKDVQITLPENNAGNIIMLDTIKMKPALTSLGGVVVIIGGRTFCSTKPTKKDTIPTLIRKVFHVEKFNVYPNPAQRGNSITIDVKREGSYSIQLFDNSGNLISVKEFEADKNATQTKINILSALNAGAYYIRLVDEKKKKQYTDKIIVM